MNSNYLQLTRLAFLTDQKTSEINFSSGVNVICGASDTGKSFLAQAIDFMLGAKTLKSIPEAVPYSEILLDLRISSDEDWRLRRSKSGGSFYAENLESQEKILLNQKHEADRTNNISGFLLEKIGLLDKKIIKNKKNATQSFSFRNFAKLSIIQEDEIQTTKSPFWDGQYTQKTVDLAAIKLILTGVDDSKVVESLSVNRSEDEKFELIDELIAEIKGDVKETDEIELTAQLDRLEKTINEQKEILEKSQSEIDTLLRRRYELLDSKRLVRERSDEIDGLLARFDLLLKHYTVDIERLEAIQESGILFANEEIAPCPLCGASQNKSLHNKACNGDVEAVVAAATAEIKKIRRLISELQETISELKIELSKQKNESYLLQMQYESLTLEIGKIINPTKDIRVSFTECLEKKSEIQSQLYLHVRASKLEARKSSLVYKEVKESSVSGVVSGLPDSTAFDFSQKISSLLKSWDFPGDCIVHFDKETSDFVIDGKPRGSRGKGLRAITHAAVSIGLLEYCQEHELPHVGFVVLDSPLLAYFKPEGEDDFELQGTNLKERFYSYLIKHHAINSQIIIIENQHPPDSLLSSINMTVFTGNPREGRKGFL